MVDELPVRRHILILGQKLGGYFMPIIVKNCTRLAWIIAIQITDMMIEMDLARGYIASGDSMDIGLQHIQET